MKSITILAAVFVAVLCSSAFAQIKPCEELKTEIEARLDAKGVQGYTLEIVPNDQVKDQKVVGSCDGGTKKITYSRDNGRKAKRG